MAELVKVGVIGCGNISGIYLQNGSRFGHTEIVACADMVIERAEAKAAEYGIKAYSVEQLLADPDIEIVINLTIPAAHGDIALKALAAGKHIYNEKPLAIRREDAQAMLALGREKNLRVGGAPDTFLGAGLQTCRKLIDEGAIGTPIAATAFMISHGPESWHPDPEFFYKVGAGPVFDMAPYYLTALTTLIGGVKAVTAATRISFPERLITSQPKYGQRIVVDVPTHVSASLELDNGGGVCLATMIMTFDVWAAALPRIEIYGSEGTLSVPDPNTFGGPVRLFRAGTHEGEDVELIAGYPQNSRGLGVADMGRAIRAGGSHRADGGLTYHVLDAMHALHESGERGARVTLDSGVERPVQLDVSEFIA
ncbi:MAG: Gfo/Idh/MocA family oxidoreductase [Chloroflexota bacterium]|nr:Gfo/Idh/MocA family oxidoreductase [Chloroflexota bacterium]